ncbi:hypothetical protein [Deinococcus frigens]|uniref:hypothetical protein n=1 Tax=Deinococcus frigens TaxID=249403 RepID=UPI0012EC1715|nr:hypothetical protein [Deinococcus frigens]
MTAKRKRLDALEVRAGQREERAWAYLGTLSDEELDAVHVDVLRRDGLPDPEGEAARIRAAVEALPDEDLRATLARFTGGRP